MVQLVSPETFEFFAKYLLAGFVFLAARARFVVGERPKPAEAVVEAVILSLVNQLLFLGMETLVPRLGEAPENLALLGEVLLLPAITGSCSGWLLSRNWMPDGLRRLFMPVSRPVTQAYQQAFSFVDTPCFVLIAYSDSREVYGYFGENSLAGSEIENGGIFLEALYTLDDEGNWQQAEPRRAAWSRCRMPAQWSSSREVVNMPKVLLEGYRPRKGDGGRWVGVSGDSASKVKEAAPKQGTSKSPKAPKGGSAIKTHQSTSNRGK